MGDIRGKHTSPGIYQGLTSVYRHHSGNNNSQRKRRITFINNGGGVQPTPPPIVVSWVFDDEFPVVFS